MKTVCLLIIVFWSCSSVFAQTELNADGVTDTYDLINSVLAPGYNVVEVPDCDHGDFGSHIDQIYDTELDQYVFRFHIHRDEDSDRCINYDRQRVEIKTYDKSPDDLKAIDGEEVEYKWRFKIESDFAPSSSFTHLHQLKAVGGSEESMPLITLTARKGNPDKLELRYAENLSQETITKVDLDDFKGQWVEVVEEVVFGETGRYKIEIKTVSESQVLFDYENTNIRMWKTGADFIRPKWGIYRSLNDEVNLKDEIVLFNAFSIHELPNTAIWSCVINAELILNPNPAKDWFKVENTLGKSLSVYNQTGQLVSQLNNIEEESTIVTGLKKGVYIVTLISQSGKLHTGKVLVY
ncbi:T9SS type A sorting domain-containing protein [Carboxylicivirga sp. N1Y90]|uniref:T9SS type A sorting domain-containing protein n=1 Tax=Carboxylicivirga fragile TaxID=3417571 RepID=UPI003D354517|nr:T9SS type A sorting domain-containing protein [Marinilabiliaceae bacterium N1Y90]